MNSRLILASHAADSGITESIGRTFCLTVWTFWIIILAENEILSFINPPS